MAVTVTELIERAMEDAVYCERCEQDFTEERTKYPPNPVNVYWQGYADVICEQCAEAEWEAANDRDSEW